MTVVINQCIPGLHVDTGARSRCQDYWVRQGVTLAQSGLEFTVVVLPQPPTCWDCRAHWVIMPGFQFAF